MKQSRQQLSLLWLCRRTLKWCSSIQHIVALLQKKKRKKSKRHNFHIQSSTPTQLMTSGLEWKRNDIIHTRTHKEGSGSSRLEQLNALLHDGINRWQRGQAIARLFSLRPSSHGYSIKMHTVLFHSQELGDDVPPKFYSLQLLLLCIVKPELRGKKKRNVVEVQSSAYVPEALCVPKKC